MSKNSEGVFSAAPAQDSISPAALTGRWIDGLTPESPLPEAARQVVRQRCSGVLYHLFLAAVDGDESAEPVHKLRVASRRLTAGLKFVAAALPRAAPQRLSHLVRKIRRAAGETRDFDVRRKFLENLLTKVADDEAEAIELLCDDIARRAARSRKRLRSRLAKFEHRLSRRGSRLLQGLAENPDSAAGGNAPAAVRDAGTDSYRSAGVRCLAERLEEVWDAADCDFESSASWHALRIACKHLRYTFENCIACLPRSFAEDYYPQLVHLQSLLGEIHDAAQALDAMKHERRDWRKQRGSRRWKTSRWSRIGLRRLLAGQEAVCRAYEDEADRARTEFRDIWPGFAGKSFRVPVEELLGRLGSLPGGIVSRTADDGSVSDKGGTLLPVEQVAASAVAAGFTSSGESGNGPSSPGVAR